MFSVDMTFPADLTRTDEGRNVISFVSGDWVATLHVRSQISVETASRSSLSEHQHEAPNHRDGGKKVAAGARQPETARGHSRQPALTDPLTTAVRPQDPLHRITPPMGR